MWLAGFADSRGKVVGVLYYELVKEHRRPTEKAPHFPWDFSEGVERIFF